MTGVQTCALPIFVQHERILTALRLGSPDAAKAAMRAHMDQTTNDLLEYTA